MKARLTDWAIIVAIVVGAMFFAAVHGGWHSAALGVAVGLSFGFGKARA